MAAFGCCQPRNANARYSQAQSEYEATVRTEGGDCSWCVEYTQHIHNHEKDTWSCDTCKGPTAKCTKCKGFLRAEGRSKYCLKCQGGWEALVDKKRSVLGAPKNVASIRADMMRDSTQRQQAASDGLTRPFLLLVSMTPAMRLVLGVNMGWSLVTESCFGDSHAEAWQLLTHRSKGLRSRCQKSSAKFFPFGGTNHWYSMLLFIAQSMYVPSYMNWDDEFQTEKLGSSDGAREAMNPTSPKVDALEIEFIEKVSKQNRSKMTRVQICTVAQLMTSENVRALMQIFQSKGMERQSIILFAMDGNFLMISKRVKQKRRDGDDESSMEVEPDLLVAEVANFVSICPDTVHTLFEKANPAALVSIPSESAMSASMIPIWRIMETLGHTPGLGLTGRALPVFMEILLQKERLKLIGISLEACTRR